MSIEMLYDSEIKTMSEEIMPRVYEMQRQHMDLQGFVERTQDLFAKAGIKVEVKTYDTTEIGTFAFDIEIVDRVDKHEFDHDKMAHEVQNNLLEIPGEGGTIGMDEGMKDLQAKHKREHGKDL